MGEVNDGLGIWDFLAGDDPFWGDRIRPDRWPKRFKKLPNLFRFELPDAYRGVYSVLTHPGRDREIRIVWLGNHKR